MLTVILRSDLNILISERILIVPPRIFQPSAIWISKKISISHPVVSIIMNNIDIQRARYHFSRTRAFTYPFNNCINIFNPSHAGMEFSRFNSSQWRDDESVGAPNHRHRDCLLNHVLRSNHERRWKKTSKLRVADIGQWSVNSPHKGPVTRKRVSTWWRHHVGQYHGCWCPGSLRRQAISSHDIDYVSWGGRCLTRRRVPASCVISVWRKDRNCKCMFISFCCKIYRVKD